MDITYLRFANSILEPVWNREHVSHVQMTIAEDFGVDDRGRFYDAVGAMRDVIQNHALQVLALVGMEPPTGNHHDSIRDKKLEFFKAMRDRRPEALRARPVRRLPRRQGRRPGLDHRDLRRGRAGGRQLALERRPLLHPRRQVHAGEGERGDASSSSGRRALGIGHGKTPEPNQLTMRIEPDAGRADAPLRQEGRRGGLRAGRPRGALREERRARSPSPTSACSATRSPAATQLFTRQDAIEETWRIVQPLLDDPGPVHPYEPGTWGPPEAEELTRGIGQWHEPWLPASA